MSKTLTDVIRDTAELPAPERLKLARRLLDLSESETEPSANVQEAWDQEIEKRLLDLRTGKVKGVPLGGSEEKDRSALAS